MSIFFGFKDVHIREMRKVTNQHLTMAFALRAIETRIRAGTKCSIEELIHATAERNVPSILKNNLNWRFVVRSKFGRGVSFSDRADYANKYCNRTNGDLRAFIICDVIVGRAKYVNDNYDSHPTKNFDSYRSYNDRVLVKFDDFTFNPKYVVYYDTTKYSTPVYSPLHYNTQAPEMDVLTITCVTKMMSNIISQKKAMMTAINHDKPRENHSSPTYVVNGNSTSLTTTGQNKTTLFTTPISSLSTTTDQEKKPQMITSQNTTPVTVANQNEPLPGISNQHILPPTITSLKRKLPPSTSNKDKFVESLITKRVKTTCILPISSPLTPIGENILPRHQHASAIRPLLVPQGPRSTSRKKKIVRISIILIIVSIICLTVYFLLNTISLH